MKNKNILLVIAGLANGGAENQIVKLWNLLNNNGYHCYLLILNKKEKVDMNFQSIAGSDKFLSLELSSQDKFLFLKILKGLLVIYKKNRIDTVISYLHIANIFTRISKVFVPKLKIITSIRSDFAVQYSIKNKLLEYILSPLSSKILSNSKATVEFLNNRIIINNKAKYFPNIIHCDDKSFFAGKYEQFTIIAVGRLSKEKNYDFLIKVANNLRKEDIKFIVLGDGNQRQYIENKIRDLDLTNVKLLGQVSNVSDYVKKSNLFFMPSFFEGVSNAMIETICQEVVVLCSSGANTSSLIENKLNGFVFDEFHSEDVAKTILRIKNMNDNELKQIAQNAKEKVKSEMNEQNILKILEEYL